MSQSVSPDKIFETLSAISDETGIDIYGLNGGYEDNVGFGSGSFTTIKKPKIQETPTHKLLGCIFKDTNEETRICNEEFKTEILPVLNRRIVTPFYIPVISLICALLLIKTKKFYLNKVSVFLYGFSLLLFTELAIRYTGISFIILTIYIILPFIFFLILYFFLVFKFSIENKVYE